MPAEAAARVKGCWLTQWEQWSAQWRQPVHCEGCAGGLSVLQAKLRKPRLHWREETSCLLLHRVGRTAASTSARKYLGPASTPLLSTQGSNYITNTALQHQPRAAHLQPSTATLTPGQLPPTCSSCPSCASSSCPADPPPCRCRCPRRRRRHPLDRASAQPALLPWPGEAAAGQEQGCVRTTNFYKALPPAPTANTQH